MSPLFFMLSDYPSSWDIVAKVGNLRNEMGGAYDEIYGKLVFDRSSFRKFIKN